MYFSFSGLHFWAHVINFIFYLQKLKLNLVKKLNVIQSLLPKWGHYVNLFLSEIFHYSIKKMWFTLKIYLCEIWKINFRYLWEGLASFWWFWPVLSGCGWFRVFMTGFRSLWLLLLYPWDDKKNARLSEVYGNFGILLLSSALTLMRMGLFGAAHGWEEGKNVPLLKIRHTYPAMMKLGIVIPYLK